MSRKASGRKSLALIVMISVMLAAAAFYPGCGGDEGGTAVEDKASEAVYPKIQEIIYPTLGYPQIVEAGEEFTLEFDFTLDDLEAALPEEVGEWRVSLTPSNGPALYEVELDVTTSEMGASLRWPADSGREVYDVYLVTAGVPEDIPPDLYDLEVAVKADGEETVDSQPNSLSVVEDIGGDYSFIQITDIHVFDVEPPEACMQDRELHHAVYLEKAVEQINLIDPDFVVFTGDLIHGQMYLPEDWPPDDERSGSSQYEYENLWAYQAMTQLDLPCFYVMGNHDGYYDTRKDGYEWWTEMFGPLYYSFDYGEHHYTMFNTMDWSQEDRLLEKGSYYGFAKILEPVKWMGQARSGGDPFGADQAPPPEEYGGQLAWIRDDLAAGGRAGMRLAFCHHDPAQIISWEDADYFGYRLGGNGEGRLALQELFSTYDVSLVMSGHEHHDLVTRAAWADGAGETVYANTTCIEPKCGITDEYPGYRLVEISGDRIVSLNYEEPKWSYPSYAGVDVGAENDLDSLSDPAIEIAFSNGGDWTTGDKDVSCTVENNLERDLEGLRLEFYMPGREPPVYKVKGADNVRTFQAPELPDWVIVYVYFDLPAGSEATVEVSPD